MARSTAWTASMPLQAQSLTCTPEHMGGIPGQWILSWAALDQFPPALSKEGGMQAHRALRAQQGLHWLDWYSLSQKEAAIRAAHGCLAGVAVYRQSLAR